MLRKFSKESSIARKEFFIPFILLFNSFVWNFMIPIIIGDLLSGLNVTDTQNLIVWVSYYAGIVISSIVGSILSKNFSRVDFLYFWVIFGTVTSSLPALFSNLTVTNVVVISVLLGVSFGLGMPSCLAYFADYTLVENRGRISGVMLLITNLSAPFFGILFEMFNPQINSIIFTVWRGFGLTIFFLKPERKITSRIEKKVSFFSILRDKPFILYFVSWLMFCFIDRFEKPILRPFFGDFHFLILMIGPIIGSLSAFIAGLLSDWVGRKRMVLYGFIALGIAYAVIGLASDTVVSWYFYITIESISTGIFIVTFWLILWGDLSQRGTREKYYVIGEAPLFLTSIIQLFSVQYVELFSSSSAFSLASFFLFLAVLPLLYAPETLPEKKIELRRLRKYVEGARKVKEKHEGKGVKG
jgi:MFS family permease